MQQSYMERVTISNKKLSWQWKHLVPSARAWYWLTTTIIIVSILTGKFKSKASSSCLVSDTVFVRTKNSIGFQGLNCRLWFRVWIRAWKALLAMTLNLIRLVLTRSMKSFVIKKLIALFEVADKLKVSLYLYIKMCSSETIWTCYLLIPKLIQKPIQGRFG